MTLHCSERSETRVRTSKRHGGRSATATVVPQRPSRAGTCVQWIRSAAPVVFVSLSLALLAGCNGDPPIGLNGPSVPNRPNVLLVSIDTLRADHVGCYGYGRKTTPFLDALAAESTRFARAFTPSSWTVPAHMSLFTSLSPHRHGVEGMRQRLPSRVRTLAQAFQAADYQTAAFLGWYFLSSRYGFGRGFDSYVELEPDETKLGDAPRAESVITAALEWLEARDRDLPFFVFVHLFDPHLHYEPPAPYDSLFTKGAVKPGAGNRSSLVPYIKGLRAVTRSIPPEQLVDVIALYDGEIRYTDAQLGRLLSWLKERGLFEDTNILVTSDHGEEFSDHGSMEGHQWTLYDEVLHVPMVLRVAGQAEGVVVEELVDLLDVAPTLLASAGLEPDPEFEGRSLLGRAEGAPSDDDALVFSRIERFNKKRAVRSARYKLIHTLDTERNRFGVSIRPGFELYDLQSDPGEQVNVIAERPEVARVLKEQLDQWSRASTPSDVGEIPPLSDEQRRMLEGLGYVE